MKKKYFINANIIDPHNSINEIGGLIIDENGKIEGVGKKVRLVRALDGAPNALARVLLQRILPCTFVKRDGLPRSAEKVPQVGAPQGRAPKAPPQEQTPPAPVQAKET